MRLFDGLRSQLASSICATISPRKARASTKGFSYQDHSSVGRPVLSSSRRNLAAGFDAGVGAAQRPLPAGNRSAGWWKPIAHSRRDTVTSDCASSPSLTLHVAALGVAHVVAGIDAGGLVRHEGERRVGVGRSAGAARPGEEIALGQVDRVRSTIRDVEAARRAAGGWRCRRAAPARTRSRARRQDGEASLGMSHLRPWHGANSRPVRAAPAELAQRVDPARTTSGTRVVNSPPPGRHRDCSL